MTVVLHNEAEIDSLRDDKGMHVPDTFYDLIETVCRDLYVQSLKEIPPELIDEWSLRAYG